MGWAWNVKAARYYNTDTGAFMARAEVMAMAEESLVAATAATDTLSTYVAEGMLSADDWYLLMREEIKRETITQYVSARGGRNVMTQRDWGSVGGMLKEQYGHLSKFHAEVLDLSEGSIRMRAAMYINSAREARERATGRVATGAGYAEVVWVVDHGVENCFPAGVTVSTPGGDRAIEEIGVGDLVETCYGPRHVLRTFARPYNGKLVTIRSGNQSVRCTTDHPFWTNERGWISAENLRSDDTLLFKGCPDDSSVHLALPDSYDCIAAGCKVGILSPVSLSLGDLPFLQRLKSRVPMPPVAIGLDNQGADFRVNDKLRLDQEVGFVFYAKRIKDAKQFLFELGRILFLEPFLALHKSFIDFWVGQVPFPHPLTNFGPPHWVVAPHSLSRGVVHKAAPCVIGDTEFQPVGLALNLFSRLVRQVSGSLISPILREELFEKLNLGIGPNSGGVPFRALALFGGLAFDTGRINDCRGLVFAANGAVATEDSLLGSGVVGISALNGTEPIDGQTGIKGLPAQFTDSLHRDNSPLWKLYTKGQESQIVYNMEIEGAHHFFANGFLVHNCDGCLELEAHGPQPVPEGGGYPGPDGEIHFPGDGNTPCLCITSPESRVLTLRGWLPLLDVRVGDFVFTHRSRWKPVTGLLVKPAAPYHRQAWLIGPGGRRVGCTDNHLWYTERGWQNAVDIQRSGALCSFIEEGADDNENLSGVRYRFATAEQAQQMHVMSVGMSLRELQGSPSGGMQILRHEQQGQGPMGQSRIQGQDSGGNCSCWQEAQGQARGFGCLQMAGEIRWPSLQLVLARRARSQKHNLPLSVGVDHGPWPDSRGPCRASYQSRCGRRPIGEFGASPESCSCEVAWPNCSCQEQEAVVDLSELREEVPYVSPRGCAPKVLLGGMLPRGAAIYDLTVQGDHSFVIEGFVAHNTSCHCGLDYRAPDGTAYMTE